MSKFAAFVQLCSIVLIAGIESTEGICSKQDEVLLTKCLRPLTNLWQRFQLENNELQSFAFSLFLYQKQQLNLLCQEYMDLGDTCLDLVTKTRCRHVPVLRLSVSLFDFICKSAATEGAASLQSFECIHETLNGSHCYKLMTNDKPGVLQQQNLCLNLREFYFCGASGVRRKCGEAGLLMYKRAIEGYGCELERTICSQTNFSELSTCLTPLVEAIRELPKQRKSYAQLVFAVFHYHGDDLQQLCSIYRQARDDCFSNKLRKLCQSNYLVRFVESNLGYACGSDSEAVFTEHYECISSVAKGSLDCIDLIRSKNESTTKENECKRIPKYYACMQGRVKASCSEAGLQIFEDALEQFGCDYQSNAKSQPNQICSQEAKIGVCDSVFVRWFFNKSNDRCEQFVYGGCGGNENNFASLNECQETCEEAWKALSLDRINAVVAEETQTVSATTLPRLQATKQPLFQNTSSADTESLINSRANATSDDCPPFKNCTDNRCKIIMTPWKCSICICKGIVPENDENNEPATNHQQQKQKQPQFDSGLREAVLKPNFESVRQSEIIDLTNSSHVLRKQLPEIATQKHDNSGSSDELPESLRKLKCVAPKSCDQRQCTLIFVSDSCSVCACPTESEPQSESEPLTTHSPSRSTTHRPVARRQTKPTGLSENWKSGNSPKPLALPPLANSRCAPLPIDCIKPCIVISLSNGCQRCSCARPQTATTIAATTTTRKQQFRGRCNFVEEQELVGCVRPLMKTWTGLRERHLDLDSVRFPLFKFNEYELKSLCSDYRWLHSTCYTRRLLKSCLGHPLITFIESALAYGCGSGTSGAFFDNYECIHAITEQDTTCEKHIPGTYSPKTAKQKCTNISLYYQCLLRPMNATCGQQAVKVFAETIQYFGCEANTVQAAVSATSAPSVDEDDSVVPEDLLKLPVLDTAANTAVSDLNTQEKATEKKKLQSTAAEASAGPPGIKQPVETVFVPFGPGGPVLPAIFIPDKLLDNETLSILLSNRFQTAVPPLVQDNVTVQLPPELILKAPQQTPNAFAKPNQQQVGSSAATPSLEPFLGHNGRQSKSRSSCTSQVQLTVEACFQPLLDVLSIVHRQASRIRNPIRFPLFSYTRSQMLDICDAYAEAFLKCSAAEISACDRDQIVRFVRRNFGFACGRNAAEFMRSFGCISEVVRSQQRCLMPLKGSFRPGAETTRCQGVLRFYSCVETSVFSQCRDEGLLTLQRTIKAFECSFN